MKTAGLQKADNKNQSMVSSLFKKNESATLKDNNATPLKLSRVPGFNFGNISVNHNESSLRAEPKFNANQVYNKNSLKPDFYSPSTQVAEEQADKIANRVAKPEQDYGGGLPRGLAYRLEQELGVNFDPVRIHSDPISANRVADFKAEAMSEGRDLYFGAGKWRPDTLQGSFLAAHEAVHAAQQGFAEKSMTSGEARYFKKDKPPKADPRDVFEEVKKRAPDLAVFINVDTINKVMAGNSAVEGPVVSGGTAGNDVHEWHISLSLSQVSAYSMTGSTPIVTTKKTKHGQNIKHIIPIVWGTFAPFGSGADYDAQGAEAEKNKTLPAHAKRGKDYAFELRISEPLIHELLHARIIMERDQTYSAGGVPTQLVQGYLDIISVSQSPALKKEREAVKSLIAILAGLHANPPATPDLIKITNDYDEFLVHEKYDSQKVFSIMGASNVTNLEIAKAYTGVVEIRLKNRFGDIGGGSFAQQQLSKLQQAIVAYYDAIDAALAKTGPATAAPVGSTGSVPAQSPAPAGTSTK